MRTAWLTFGALLWLAASAQAQTLERVRDTGIFKIGYREDAAPFSFRNTLGEPVGRPRSLSIAQGCRLMGLPRSTFYDIPAAPAEEAEVVARMRAICDEFESYRASVRPADARQAAARRGLRHRPVPQIRQAQLPAPAGGRPRSERRLPPPRAPGAAGLVMGRATLGAAEALPFADADFDLVTCIYLFHELPRPVRARAVAEFARVLRPGGRLVLVDAFQRGDEPAFDGLLELFPLAYHEPYFDDYAPHDLGALFAEVGLQSKTAERAHMSKVMTFDKP
jgi:SAM-dependent methyltransferase